MVEMSGDDTATSASAAEITSIWLTRPSVKPIWLALTLLGMLAGLFVFLPLLVLSAVAALLIAISWAAEAHAGSNELPPL